MMTFPTVVTFSIPNTKCGAPPNIVQIRGIDHGGCTLVVIRGHGRLMLIFPDTQMHRLAVPPTKVVIAVAQRILSMPSLLS